MAVDTQDLAPLSLTDEQRQNLLNMGNRIEWLKTELAKATRAGIATEDMEAKLKDLIKMRDGILREYT